MTYLYIKSHTKEYSRTPTFALQLVPIWFLSSSIYNSVNDILNEVNF